MQQCNVPTMLDPTVYDKLCILANEYETTKESLVQLAVQRLISDVEFVRSLRNINHHPNAETRSAE
jgi:hypothetical protein